MDEQSLYRMIPNSIEVAVDLVDEAEPGDITFRVSNCSDEETAKSRVMEFIRTLAAQLAEADKERLY